MAIIVNWPNPPLLLHRAVSATMELNTLREEILPHFWESNFREKSSLQNVSDGATSSWEAR